MVVLALTSLATPALEFSGDGTQPVDGIVAVVDDDVILVSELDRRLRTVLSRLRERGTMPPPPDVLRRQVLERLVLQRLQLARAENTGIRVDDQVLNEAVRSIANRNGLGLAEFRDILESEGFDFAEFREDIRVELIISRLRERLVERRVRVSNREVDDYLATARDEGEEVEYRLGHILVSVPEAASPEEIATSQAKADRVLEALRGGADFRRLAVAESDGQQALDGGDLGWRKRNQIPTLFSEAVLSLQDGEVSEVIRSPSGFHIIKVLGLRRGNAIVVKQTHVRHILVNPDELTSDREARIRVEQLRSRVINGESFDDLARSHSDDAGSAIKGGDLGWVSPAAMVPVFEQAMNRLSPGELSPPFRSQFGWHVVEVLGRRDYDSTLEVRRTKAREAIRARKMDEEVQSWLRRMLDEAYVDYRLDQL